MKSRRVLFLTALASLACAAPGFAVPTGLWNTGVDDTGAVLPVGSPEQHYIVSSLSSAPIEVVNVASPYWLTPTAADSAAWIGPDIAGGNQGALDDDPNPIWWFYDLTFTTSSATPTVSGNWASDNNSLIYLNGVSTGFSVGPAQFGALTPFSISSGFAPGVNILTFAVYNAAQTGGNPSGLIVTGMPNSHGVPDAGGTVLLLGLGLLGVAAARRFQSKR